MYGCGEKTDEAEKTTEYTEEKTDEGFNDTLRIDEKEIIIPVVEVVYHYTIYYYDFDATHMSENASDLWIWQKSGAGATAGTLFTAKEKLSDGNEWLRADVTLPYTDVQIIPRSKDEWTWKGDTVLYNNSAKAENVTLYIVSNSNQAYTTLPELVEPKSRSIMVEYDRPANDYEGWNIFTWNSGFGDKVTVDFENINGKMVAKIPVKDSKADLKLSFCMRHSTADNEWASKDGGDHYVTIPAGQSLVKAVFTQGEGITEVLPYNAGYEMDGATIHFYYRNDTLAAENNLASLDGKVSVVVNGRTCPMTYDAANDRFGYDFTGVSTGDYYYYYVVNEKEELDAFNDVTAEDSNGKECSVCHYKKANVSVEASLSQYAMDYNDNNVLSVKLTAKDGEGLETSEIAAITADLSGLGLGKEFAIDPKLMEGTISCLNTVAAGEKTIPVTVKDIYGNVYTTATNVTVTERKKSAGDFDWDEAVIYFAVTDRFFDGDASNNDAYGVGDYNTGEKGGSSYHGGDFAGLNQKLDYLKDLGVNTIWITPIVENITEDQHDNKTDIATYGYHGYWASDFTKLNGHLGTEQQFKALLDAAHSKGMKIMVDVVLNHAGYGTEDYFNNILTDADGNRISMIRDSNNTISGDDKYDSNTLIKNITVIPVEFKLNVNEVIKFKGGKDKLIATLIGGQGNPIVNASIVFAVNGVNYTKYTNERGMASMNINLNPGEYILTSIHPNGLQVGKKVTVLPTLEGSDLTMNYKDGSQFKARLVDGTGRALANKTVTFNINGVFYKDYLTKYSWNTLCLGKYNKGDTINVTIEFTHEIIMDDIYFYYENLDIFNNHYNILKENEVKIKKTTSSNILGTISLEDSSYVLFTIPYDKGFECLIDGKHVNIESALDSLIAVKVESGTHEIELIYNPPGLKLGIYISLGTLILTTCYLMCKKRTK